MVYSSYASKESLVAEVHELFSTLPGGNQNIVVSSIRYGGHANSRCLGGFPLADVYGGFAFALFCVSGVYESSVRSRHAEPLCLLQRPSMRSMYTLGRGHLPGRGCDP